MASILCVFLSHGCLTIRMSYLGRRVLGIEGPWQSCWAFLSLPGSSCSRRLLLGTSTLRPWWSSAVLLPDSATETQTGQPCLLRWEV